jgi:hypothetical protein
MSTAERKCVAVAEQRCISWRDEKGPRGSPLFWCSAGLLVPGVGAGRASTVLTLPEPIARAVHLKDVDVMGEAVEERTGQALGAEHAGPLVERQIAGDDDRAPPRSQGRVLVPTSSRLPEGVEADPIPGDTELPAEPREGRRGPPGQLAVGTARCQRGEQQAIWRQPTQVRRERGWSRARALRWMPA